MTGLPVIRRFRQIRHDRIAEHGKRDACGLPPTLGRAESRLLRRIDVGDKAFDVGTDPRRTSIHAGWGTARTPIRQRELSLEMSLKFERKSEKPVELRGFEPLTFCMPCRRATSCAIAPQPTIRLPRTEAPCVVERS
jgi:hypothetical protein